jgi:hypothetical protein
MSPLPLRKLALISAGFAVAGYAMAYPFDGTVFDWVAWAVIVFAPGFGVVIGWRTHRDRGGPLGLGPILHLVALALWALGALIIARNSIAFISYLAPIDAFYDGLAMALMILAPILTMALLIVDAIRMGEPLN